MCAEGDISGLPCEQPIFGLFHMWFAPDEDEWIALCYEHIQPYAELFHCYRPLQVDARPLPLVGLAVGSREYKSAWEDAEL